MKIVSAMWALAATLYLVASMLHFYSGAYMQGFTCSASVVMCIVISMMLRK